MNDSNADLRERIDLLRELKNLEDNVSDADNDSLQERIGLLRELKQLEEVLL
jgi:hypothetical protein